MGWSDGAPAKVESLSRYAWCHHGFANSHEHYWSWIGIIKKTHWLNLRSCGTNAVQWWLHRYNTSSQGDQPGPWTFAQHLFWEHSTKRTNDRSRRSSNGCIQCRCRTGAFMRRFLSSGVRLSVQDYCHGLLRKFLILLSIICRIKFKGDKMVIKPALYKTPHRLCRYPLSQRTHSAWHWWQWTCIICYN